MDIDRQIASLDDSSMFNTESPKALVVKILVIFLVSGFLTYMVRPLGILKLKYDVEQKKCSYEIIKKNFIILSLIISVVTSFTIWYFRIF
jgi:hypothetical protein